MRQFLVFARQFARRSQGAPQSTGKRSVTASSSTRTKADRFAANVLPVINKATSVMSLSEPNARGAMRGNKWWILAGASGVIMLMALEAATAELPSDQPSNDWVQSSGRHNKDCLEWNDRCVNCVRAQSGDDYSCSNIGIACQKGQMREAR
jgi:hypothetical protein